MAFDRVHKGEATQQDLYECCSDMVETALQGYNACIMTYGQTGAVLAPLIAGCLLTALGKVVNALATGKNGQHIPYRFIPAELTGSLVALVEWPF